MRRRLVLALVATTLAVDMSAAQGLLQPETIAVPAAAFSVSKIGLNTIEPLRPAGPVFRTGVPAGDGALSRLKTAGQFGPGGRESSLATEVRGTPFRCLLNKTADQASSDTQGAVTASTLIQLTNSAISIYRKSDCIPMARATMRDMFGAFDLRPGETLRNARIFYDVQYRRCFVSAESRDSAGTDQSLYIAVSRDESCLQWSVYRVALSRDASVFCKSARSDVWDYSVGGSANASGAGRWIVTANVFSAQATLGAVLSIDKATTLSGETTYVRCFRGLSPNPIAPIVLDSSATAYVLSAGSGSGRSIARYQLSMSGSGAAIFDRLTTTEPVDIDAWAAAPDAAQTNGRKLETLDGRFQSPTQQFGDSLWNVHTINVDGFARLRAYNLPIRGRKPKSVLLIPSTANNRDHLFSASLALIDDKLWITAFRTIPGEAVIGRPSVLMLNGSLSSAKGWRYQVIETSNAEFTNCNPCGWSGFSATQPDSQGKGVWGFGQTIIGPQQHFDWRTRAGQVN